MLLDDKDEIRNVTFVVLSKLAADAASKFTVAILDALAAVFDKILNRKINAEAPVAEVERSQEVVRNAVRAIRALQRLLPAAATGPGERWKAIVDAADKIEVTH